MYNINTCWFYDIPLISCIGMDTELNIYIGFFLSLSLYICDGCDGYDECMGVYNYYHIITIITKRIVSVAWKELQGTWIKIQVYRADSWFEVYRGLYV